MTTETATFAGGCFWCTEAIFSRLKGVILVQSGYTGGNIGNPSYEEVSTGKTGHVEAIQITYDLTIISFETLLRVFFATHDPTTLNQQGADRGTQYRSAIFYHNEEQKKLAVHAKSEIAGAVTEIVPFAKFYKAEDYHQNFYNTNREYGYCRIVIDPKVKKLVEEFGRIVKEDP